MKKIFTLTLFLMAVLASSAQIKKTWDFTQGLSYETKENLAADKTSWADNGNDADGNVNNWKNIGKPSTTSYLMANGVVIPETMGLLFDIGSNKDNSIHLADTKMRLTRKGTKITFPKLANGQKITIQGRSANGTATNRGIAPNKDYIKFVSGTQTGGACIFLGNQVDGSEGTYTFVWQVQTESADSVDVDFILTPDGGIDFTLFMIDEGDEPAVEDAQSIGYLFSGSTDEDYAYAYLAGDSRFALTDINVDNTEASADSLRQFKAIVVSPTIAASSAYLNTIREAIAFVPTLNLNVALYEPLGLGKAVDSGTNVLTVVDKENPMFEGLEITEGLELLTEGTVTGVQLGDYFANDDIVATAGETTAVHIHNAKRNAYMLLPLSVENMMVANQDVISQLIPQALQTVADSKQEVKPVAKPVINVEQKNGYSVVSISANYSTQIFYTLDGSDPTTQSTVYTEPFTITKNTVVKAFGIGDGYTPSAIAEKEAIVCVNAAAPVFSITREAGRSLVTITSASAGANVYYNFANSTDATASVAYSEPVEVTTPTTIYAYADGDDYLPSELVSTFVGVDGIDKSNIRWDVMAHFDANADEWSGKGQQTDDSGNIINANYFFTWGKNAGQYLDTSSIKEIVKTEEGNDSTIYNPLPAEVYESGDWRLKSIGQVLTWEKLDYKFNIGDTNYRNPDAAEDVVGANDTQGITNNAVTFGKQPADGPFNASLETTRKYQAPFDVIIYAGNGNEGQIPTMQVEVSADGETWAKVGDVAYSLIKRNWKRTQLSYDGTDEVYVRILHTAAKSGGQIYDMYLMNNGEYSKQYDEGSESGIAAVGMGAEVVRTEVYTVNGMRVPAFGKGVNILRTTFSDGSVKTRKVVVR